MVAHENGLAALVRCLEALDLKSHLRTFVIALLQGRFGVAPLPAGDAGWSTSLNVYWLLALGSGSRLTEEAFVLDVPSIETLRCARSEVHFTL